MQMEKGYMNCREKRVYGFALLLFLAVKKQGECSGLGLLFAV